MRAFLCQILAEPDVKERFKAHIGNVRSELNKGGAQHKRQHVDFAHR